MKTSKKYKRRIVRDRIEEGDGISQRFATPLHIKRGMMCLVKVDNGASQNRLVRCIIIRLEYDMPKDVPVPFVKHLRDDGKVSLRHWSWFGEIKKDRRPSGDNPS